MAEKLSRGLEAGVDADALTQRQKLVLRLSAKGLSNNEIGLQLNISNRTAEVHKGTVFKKLGVHNRADMILKGIGKGLISIEDCVDEKVESALNRVLNSTNINLTSKERETLEKMIELQTISHQTVGSAMGIHSATINTHVYNLMKRLNLHAIDRALVLYMLQQKMQANSQPPPKLP